MLNDAGDSINQPGATAWTRTEMFPAILRLSNIGARFAILNFFRQQLHNCSGIHFTGPLSVLIQNGMVLKSGYKEGYLTRKDDHRLTLIRSITPEFDGESRKGMRRFQFTTNRSSQTNRALSPART